ncbi:DUF4442 domain-containing protein [Robertkochia marina]|uniref:DUF4442 domain-containing protein n=1 Tax=Robertkochia marina TaxID=1227945 RepID=A0A4S3M3F7_9FLAO|nr:DUF4442 domain-containing protein [Robertkochia marina]THD68035.1 DUF4442 domain-containing protein [Robertkochia marina]TRZ42681.1 DUF4442 domain-containing protein [Robertkochia marina]
MTPSKLNTFTLFKLPSAWISGVRVESFDANKAVTRVKHRWINQNPFNSMFWAVQGMAAELATGVLVMSKIRAAGKPVSMLVLNNKATFSKKATGTIRFTCDDGEKLDAIMTRVLETGEGHTCWMRAVGKDEAGDVVSVFEFEWTLRRKDR